MCRHVTIDARTRSPCQRAADAVEGTRRLARQRFSHLLHGRLREEAVVAAWLGDVELADGPLYYPRGARRAPARPKPESRTVRLGVASINTASGGTIHGLREDTPEQTGMQAERSQGRSPQHHAISVVWGACRQERAAPQSRGKEMVSEANMTTSPGTTKLVIQTPSGKMQATCERASCGLLHTTGRKH